MPNDFIYCPRCAAPLAEGIKFGRTRRFCRYCGFIHFREPKVAVAGLVSDAGRVLLVRRAAVPGIGYWALPAGYMDADELPDEAVVREVAEETGVVVRVTALHAVAPLAGWAERRGILVLYRAERVSGEPASARRAGSIGRRFRGTSWRSSPRRNSCGSGRIVHLRDNYPASALRSP